MLKTYQEHQNVLPVSIDTILCVIKFLSHHTLTNKAKHALHDFEIDLLSYILVPTALKKADRGMIMSAFHENIINCFVNIFCERLWPISIIMFKAL